MPGSEFERKTESRVTIVRKHFPFLDYKNFLNLVPVCKKYPLSSPTVLSFFYLYWSINDHSHDIIEPRYMPSEIVRSHLKAFNCEASLKNQGPVVQSVFSLTSSLRVISLTVLADSIYNILIFLAEKLWVAFALQKLLTFFQQKISAYLRITRCKF